MPLVTEFSTEGRLKCSIPDRLRTRTRTRSRNLKSKRSRWPRRGDFPVHLQVLHNGDVVHSKSYGNADAREF